MLTQTYFRIYGTDPDIDARNAGYFAARVSGPEPRDWLGLELEGGKRWLSASLASWYLCGFEEGQARNRREGVAA